MKHAYLIIAHNDFYILEKLIKQIDDKRNDIYIHIDKKVKQFDFDYYKRLVKNSNLYFTKRINVNWAAFSQIECELLLFEAAHKNHYDYYHLLSGCDLLLKTQDEIHDFFDKNQGKEFISFAYHDKALESTRDRIEYYHLFTSGLRAKNKIKQKIFSSLHYRLFNFLKKHKIKRKITFEIRKAAQWVSITDDLVSYILKNKTFLKQHFKYSYCSDEIFIPTLVYNSKFYDNLYGKHNDDYDDSKRYIDWKRGQPYTFTNDDFEELINSGEFFARKFSTNVDKKIIDRIYEYVRNDVHDKN